MARPRRELSAPEMQIGQPQSKIMPGAGNISGEEFRDSFEIVDGPTFADKAAAEAFNAEILTVVVQTTTNPNDEPIPCVRVGGVTQYFMRGVKQKVKRMFVEGLARAKPVSVDTREITDQDGFRATRVDTRIGLKYPFSVLHDPNPKGAAWLEKILAEA